MRDSEMSSAFSFLIHHLLSSITKRAFEVRKKYYSVMSLLTSKMTYLQNK